jgi:hypothetical protein
MLTPATKRKMGPETPVVLSPGASAKIVPSRKTVTVR